MNESIARELVERVRRLIAAARYAGFATAGIDTGNTVLYESLFRPSARSGPVLSPRELRALVAGGYLSRTRDIVGDVISIPE